MIGWFIYEYFDYYAKQLSTSSSYRFYLFISSLLSIISTKNVPFLSHLLNEHLFSSLYIIFQCDTKVFDVLTTILILIQSNQPALETIILLLNHHSIPPFLTLAIIFIYLRILKSIQAFHLFYYSSLSNELPDGWSIRGRLLFPSIEYLGV